VRPMGAQVVAVLARHEKPVSSTKTIVASGRRAFVDPRLIALEPGFDPRLITFPGIDRGLLRTPPQGLQPTGEVMGMIVNPTLHHHDGADPTKRPPLRLNTCTQGSLFEPPQQTWPLGGGQMFRSPDHECQL
jgi:hypothetical protein